MEGIHVVVLAAGKGMRLGALGTQTPKWLLDIGGRTIADHQLEGLDRAAESLPGSVASVRVITGHAVEAIERYLSPGSGREVEIVHNDDYSRLNNWYSVLLALRSIDDDNARVAIINGDLFAHSDWIAQFLIDSVSTSSDSLIAIDLERTLTDESMKVSARDGASALEAIGKVGVEGAVGEYVGMLMAGGSVLGDFRRCLESFEGRADAANEWYERAVGLTAAKGTHWAIWPTPSSRWVEIDDDSDHATAVELSESS